MPRPRTVLPFLLVSEARFTAPNRVEVTTRDLGAFTLHLTGHPQHSAERPLETRIDGRVIRTRVGEPLSFSRQGNRWAAVAHQAPALAKRPGAEGPISAAIASRHVYVYGTGGDPSSQELEARRAQATQAANWSVNRGPFFGRVMVFPRTVADRDVRPSDLETSNLVLFGTRETNNLIAQYADRLPLHLDAGATNEYGLLYVFPVGERYVLVSSGLPWWRTTRPTSGAAPAPPPLLAAGSRPSWVTWSPSASWACRTSSSSAALRRTWWRRVASIRAGDCRKPMRGS